MALDAIAVRALAKEISNAVNGGRIDKIYQPERDEIVLGIRTFTDNYKLLLCANSTYPRVHFTNINKKNPQTAPLFCMLLRKHLGSGKIVSVKQVDFERIIEFEIESYDELGDLTLKKLIIEIMGRHSNIILTIDGKIIDSIKHIDLTVSSVRQVLPGFLYSYPPARNITPLDRADENLNIDISQKGELLQKSVLSCVSGISPLTSREIVYSNFKRTDIRNEEISDTKDLVDKILSLKDKVLDNSFTPTLITDAFTGKLIDFSAIPIHQYEQGAKTETFSTLSEVIDKFYSKKDAAERMRQKSYDLVKLLTVHRERAAKKQGILLSTLKDAKSKDKYKVYGELLCANLYRISDTDTEIEVENYYDENLPIVKIPLDAQLSPSDNAQKYFKKYQKLKNAETEAAKQLKENEAVLEYLESTLVLILNTETESDLNAIRTELSEQGYLKRIVAKKNQRLSNTSKPMHFVSSDGFDIYVGKNNTQNDYLTLKFANSNDIWFHTKNIHGSHVIIKLGLDKDVPENTLRQAAELAAYYSKARESSQVPVDYTLVKNVKKPNGAKPGMVIYDHYNTVYVTPKKISED